MLTALSVTVLSVGVLAAACSGKDITDSFVVDETQTLTVSGKKGDAVEMPSVTKEGYIFKGWYANAEFTGESVTSATFDAGVTYYAKWAKGYAVTFDLDGGQLSTTTLYLEEGASVAAAVKDYTPTKADLQFGGWYVGDDALSSSLKMTTEGVTLTAKYKAAYTVNVHLQNADLSTYTFTEAYESGYALVGEEFTPSLNIPGYTVNGEDETSLIISESASKNVFVLHYDRESYTLLYNANYSNGAIDSKQESHVYGVEFSLSENTFVQEGYRFLGWAESADATYADIIRSGKYTITQDTMLYAVWNKGYQDMFNGYDVIYKNHDAENTITVCRGGKEITGVYNEKKEIYILEGEEESVSVKLNENGTFVYYTNRQGSYQLFRNNNLNDKVTISLDNTNGVRYTSSVEGDMFVKSGIYIINEEGIYVADLTDEVTGEKSEIYFTIGQAYDRSGKTYNVFRIRGDEYAWGLIGRLGLYYPAFELDGFGNATYMTSAGQSTYYNYTLVDNVVTLTNVGGTKITVRLGDYDGNRGYEEYNSTFDRAFADGEATLTLDGCSSAVYEKGDTKITGTYTYAQSIFGGFLVTVTVGQETYLYRVYATINGMSYEFKFEEKAKDYTEYLFVDDDGMIKRAPYFVDHGDGTASFYEANGGAIDKASTGTLVKNGDRYIYTVNEEGVADWATFRATEADLSVMVNGGNCYYYLHSYTEGDTEKDYVRNYTAGKEKLSITSVFATYTDKDGNVVEGICIEYPNYIRVMGEKQYYYFALNEETKTFEVLDNAPLNLIQRKNGVIDSNTLLSVNGKTVGTTEADSKKFVAVYMPAGGANVEGYYTSAIVEGLGGRAEICTFVANDASVTFKFIVTNSSSSYFFNYFEIDEVITLVTYTAINDSDAADNTVKLSLTDEKKGDLLIAVYTVGETSVKGTLTSETVTAFGAYEAEVYTFTPVDGSKAFRFTLSGSSAFRICVEEGTYISSDGGTLQLDGATHIARYTDKNGTKFDNYYLVVENILDKAERAIRISMDGTNRFFDLKESDKTFALRGLEAKSYLIIKNGTVGEELLRLDGHGSAYLKALDAEETDPETRASYKIADDTITVTLSDKTTYVGSLGTYTIGNTRYNALILNVSGAEGAYLNKADLSVLVLDNLGNAVKYNSMGELENGTYVVISDRLFYYVSSDRSSAALYTYGNGEIKTATFEATYYADDFASIVFHKQGVVLFNNANPTYYEAVDGKIYTYKLSDSKEANAYGYLKEELVISDEKITYTDETTGQQREYYYFNGEFITFTDAAGNTLEFQPDGNAAFIVTATYRKKDAEDPANYSVVVDYDEEGNVMTFLAVYTADPLSGSATNYRFLRNYDLEISFKNKTFVFNDAKYEFLLTSYEYQYLYLLFTYGQMYAPFFQGQLGVVNVFGSSEGGEVSYTLTGQLNFVKGVDQEEAGITFTDGTLSTAGYYHSTYGNLYISEFTGSDGAKYHMSFFLYYVSATAQYSTIIYSLTRVTDTLDLGENTLIYEEEYVYTSGFRFVKSTDEETGEETYYEYGESFFPSLRYQGELICSHGYTDLGNNEWRFSSAKYNGKTHTNYHYHFKYEVDLEDNITGGEVIVRAEGAFKTTTDNNVVYAIYNVADNSIEEVYGLVINNNQLRATDCVKNADGSFTVTCDRFVYKVTFTTTTNEEGQEETTVTIEDVKDEA